MDNQLCVPGPVVISQVHFCRAVDREGLPMMSSGCTRADKQLHSSDVVSEQQVQPCWLQQSLTQSSLNRGWQHSSCSQGALSPEIKSIEHFIYWKWRGRRGRRDKKPIHPVSSFLWVTLSSWKPKLRFDSKKRLIWDNNSHSARKNHRLD